MNFNESHFLQDSQVLEGPQFWEGGYVRTAETRDLSIGTEHVMAQSPGLEPGNFRYDQSDHFSVPSSQGRHVNQLSNSGPSNASGRHRWENWQLKMLLELKRDELEEAENNFARANIVSAAVKWDKIDEKMRRGEFGVDGKQCKNKWDSTLALYKKVWEHQLRSGNESYWTLSANDKKAKQLLAAFDQECFDLLEQFFGGRPSMTPPSATDSSLMSDNIEDEEDSDPSEKTMTSKRKRSSGESVKVVVDAIDGSMTNFTNCIREVKGSRQIFAREVEKERTIVEKERTDVIKDNCRNLCSVLGILASVLGDIAKTRKH